MASAGNRFAALLVGLALTLGAGLVHAGAASGSNLTAAPVATEPAGKAPWLSCTMPEHRACTRELRPVCAVRDTGVRCIKGPCHEASERRTYPNACIACSDPGVFRYMHGGC